MSSSVKFVFFNEFLCVHFPDLRVHFIEMLLVEQIDTISEPYLSQNLLICVKFLADKFQIIRCSDCFHFISILSLDFGTEAF